MLVYVFRYVVCVIECYIIIPYIYIYIVFNISSLGFIVVAKIVFRIIFLNIQCMCIIICNAVVAYASCNIIMYVLCFIVIMFICVSIRFDIRWLVLYIYIYIYCMCYVFLRCIVVFSNVVMVFIYGWVIFAKTVFIHII